MGTKIRIDCDAPRSSSRGGGQYKCLNYLSYWPVIIVVIIIL